MFGGLGYGGGYGAYGGGYGAYGGYGSFGGYGTGYSGYGMPRYGAELDAAALGK